MQAFETTPKKWGNSLGIIIPKELADAEGVNEGTRIRVTISPKEESLFSTLWNAKAPEQDMSTEQIMRMIDEELWNA